MNTVKDFHKKNDSTVINTNSKDFVRAKNRNYTRKEQDKIIGENGKVASLEKELNDLKNLVKELMENK